MLFATVDLCGVIKRSHLQVYHSTRKVIKMKNRTLIKTVELCRVMKGSTYGHVAI